MNEKSPLLSQASTTKIFAYVQQEPTNTTELSTLKRSKKEYQRQLDDPSIETETPNSNETEIPLKKIGIDLFDYPGVYDDPEGTFSGYLKMPDYPLRPFWTTPFSDLPKEEEVDRIISRIFKHNGRGNPNPRLIISVTGGAQNFHINLHIEKMFAGGLVKAAQNSDALVVTGGFDVGVMKYVGKAVARSQTEIRTIGIACLKKMTGWEDLKKLKYPEDHHYPKADSKSVKTAQTRKILPEPNHTHFVFVDLLNKEKNEFGKEIGFRSLFEDKIAKYLEIPVILVVVEGGRGTFNTIREAAEKGFPIVLCKGTGGVADKVSNLLEGKPIELEVKTDVEWNTDLQTVNKILELHKEKGTIFIYDPSGFETFDDIVLASVLKTTQKINLRTKLLFPVWWNNLGQFKRVYLEELSRIKQSSSVVKSPTDDTLQIEEKKEKDIEEVCKQAFLDSLRLDHPDFIRYFFDELGSDAKAEFWKMLSPTPTDKNPATANVDFWPPLYAEIKNTPQEVLFQHPTFEVVWQKLRSCGDCFSHGVEAEQVGPVERILILVSFYGKT